MTTNPLEAVYNPVSAESRRLLASTIIARLTALGAQDRPNIPSGQERQIARRLRNADGRFSLDLQVVVYTTIVGNEVRNVGKDAIRVALLYKCKPDAQNPHGRVIGVGSDTRVNRVGRICDIVDRMIERWNNVEAGAPALERCKCGAPRIMKRDKSAMYCAEKCWLKK